MFFQFCFLISPGDCTVSRPLLAVGGSIVLHIRAFAVSLLHSGGCRLPAAPSAEPRVTLHRTLQFLHDDNLLNTTPRNTRETCSQNGEVVHNPFRTLHGTHGYQPRSRSRRPRITHESPSGEARVRQGGRERGSSLCPSGHRYRPVLGRLPFSPSLLFVLTRQPTSSTIASLF